MDHSSTISAFQKVLKSFTFTGAASFSEEFAIKRFLKKFEEPQSANNIARKELCWTTWLENDKRLPNLKGRILLPEWYIARMIIHSAFQNGFDVNEFSFPKGSEFHPTEGHNSLEARLSRSSWTVTSDAYDQFKKVVFSHKGLTKAARERYNRWYQKQNFDLPRSSADSMMYREARKRLDHRQAVLFIKDWKFSKIVEIHEGSRFATVPKNNAEDRPINVECFGNIICQSQIGNGIRKILKTEFGADLNNLQQIHRLRISDLENATIDLRNASDSISLDLCEFLLPKRVFRRILDARSSLIFGPDKNYHLIRKVSSMGNGFTFELMSLILTAICRTLDQKSSVYGDDIIIKSDSAPRLIKLLESVGLQVNLSKSFIDGPFRESCGGNYHETEGYIDSFDFRWPVTINDCVMVANKAYLLGNRYASFKRLHESLLRVIPTALRSGVHMRLNSLQYLSTKSGEQTAIPGFFLGGRVIDNLSYKQRHVLRCDFGLNPEDFRACTEFFYEDAEHNRSTDTLRSWQWAKYEMYLASGRITPDTIKNRGRWCSRKVITDGKVNFSSRELRDRYRFYIS